MEQHAFNLIFNTNNQMRKVKLPSKIFLELSGLVIVMKPCRINGKIFEWILISRRSCFRAGVRYYVRGKTTAKKI